MKRVLSVLMAGAMTVAMAVPALAATDITTAVYDADGKVISVPDSGDVWGDDVNVPYATTNTKYTIDGVVPGITMYIPLGSTMASTITGGTAGKSDADAKTEALTEVAKSVVTIADGAALTGVLAQADAAVTDIADIKDVTDATGTAGHIYYSKTKEALNTIYTNTFNAAKVSTAYSISLNSLTNTDYFKFDVDKDEGSKYVSKIEVVDDKKMSELNQRTAFLKVTLADSTTTSDLKTTGTITFKAKGNSSSYTGSKAVKTDVWSSGNDVTIDYTFWINNVKKQNDDNIDTGDRVYFDPDDNEDNTLVWGDDRAALFFEANDDASKFYARLQTKSDSEIYSTYADPVNADLWFFDFVGNPTVPATSRATLTLGIPWDEDDDYTPNPEDCFIYEKDADGNLTDVTSKFTYSEDNDGTTEIPGWTIKTRTLGTYVISDTELDTTVADDVDEEPADDTSSAVVDGGKEIPNTGSSDMVGVAVVAAVVSLAAAGAVAFKKASK